MTNETLDYVRVIAAHAARCTACHGIAATPYRRREHRIAQVRPPLVVGDVTERQSQPLPFDAGDDQASRRRPDQPRR